MVTGMLASYARTATDAASRQGIDQIVRRVTTLAQIYDSLLGVGLSETIDLGDYLRALCASLPELQDGRSRQVDLVCQADSIPLALDVVTALGMVVAELVTNSYGHAFPDGAGKIAVTLVRSADADGATLTIQDDGVGFEAKGESSRRGLGLVRRLMEQVNGTLDIRSDNGTIWTLTFGVPAPPDGVRAAA